MAIYITFDSPHRTMDQQSLACMAFLASRKFSSTRLFCEKFPGKHNPVTGSLSCTITYSYISSPSLPAETGHFEYRHARQSDFFLQVNAPSRRQLPDYRCSPELDSSWTIRDCPLGAGFFQGLCYIRPPAAMVT